MAVYDTAKDGSVDDVKIVDFSLTLDNNRNTRVEDESDGSSTQIMKSQCKETPRCPWISRANESSKLRSNFASDVDEAMDSRDDLSLRLGQQCNPEPSTQPFTNCSETQILINPTDSSEQSAASCGKTADDLDIDLNNSRNCTTQSNTTSASQSMSSSNDSLSMSQSSQSMS
ncbi:hypothetical protein PCASD_26233 [Puccinia coronata f. sp. avenae]|uniref:Uncharacterized protein n=1 Tax=Puccinia coronata f. sp. avenae TaxID=200324 RepID=A0A2N5RWU3_9BASI|nr:hypothetical protein PCASD_26233 [Puccinia coronata f. sp. avenae]